MKNQITKRITLFNALLILSSALVFFNCSDDEAMEESVTLSAFSITATSGLDFLTLDWEDVTASNQQNISYDVFVDGALIKENLSTSTYKVNDLEAGTNYLIKVIAKDESGNQREVEKTFTTSSKPVPTEVAISSKDISRSGFTIDWTAATVDGDQGLKYDVSLDGSVLATDLEVLTYTFSDLEAEQAYEVKVTAKSIEFGTSTSKILPVTTAAAPKPNDFTLSTENIQTTSAVVRWTSLTIDGEGGVLADLYINGAEETIGSTASGYTFTFLTANTEYTIRVVARSTAYGTTLEKEITFKTEPLPSTFEVTSAKILPRTTGTFDSPPLAIIRFSNRDLLEGIVLNDKTYGSFAFAGSDGISILLTDEEYEALSNAAVKEGTANFTENGTADSITFTYTLD